jgi:hypothetical protein
MTPLSRSQADRGPAVRLLTKVPEVSFVGLAVFIALVGWITLTRRDVQVGHNAENQDHAHATPILVTEPE